MLTRHSKTKITPASNFRPRLEFLLLRMCAANKLHWEIHQNFLCRNQILFEKAVRNANPEMLLKLFPHVNLEAIVYKGCRALHWAVLLDCVPMLSLLLRLGANVNSTNSNGNTALHLAALKGNTLVCSLLISHGATLVVVGNEHKKFTPLHFSCSFGHHETSFLLSQSFSLLQCLDGEGNTSLHRAAQFGHTKVCAILLQRGANPFSRNYVGKLPIDLAKSKSAQEVIRIGMEHYRIYTILSHKTKNQYHPIYTLSTSMFLMVVDMLV